MSIKKEVKMDCREIKEYLYLFLDGQLDDQTSSPVKAHLSDCPLCRLEFEQEKRIDSLIKSNIPNEETPYELKEIILDKLEELGERKINPLSHIFLKPVLATSLVAFLITILTFSIFVNINKPFPVFNESVKDHIQFLQGNLSIDIASNKPQEVQNWLRTKLDFRIMVPDLSSQEVNLLGARICSLKEKKTAYIMYEKDGHNISVFMFDAKGLKFPKAKRIAVNNKTFYLSKEKGYNSALWIEEGIACVFVSDLSEIELLHLASL